MNALLLALQFLTIIPVRLKQIEEKKFACSVMFFPFTGFLLGVLLLLVAFVLSWLRLPEISISIFLVVLLAALTGGMHLDGLADTADAFLSRKDKDAMLSIMRDSHIGVMGVLSIICALLLKIALIYALGFPLKLTALLLMCLLSRWAMALAIFLFPYARQEGKAKFFFQGMNLKIFAVSTIAALVLTFNIWQWKGLIVMAAIALMVYLSGSLIRKRIGGITGDTIGAVNELTELLVLFMVIIIGGIIV